jgi:hypothetical protein
MLCIHRRFKLLVSLAFASAQTAFFNNGEDGEGAHASWRNFEYSLPA